MSMAIGHFAVGASGTMLLFHMLPPRVRFKMRIAQVFIIVSGGLWAMLPDAAQFSNFLQYFNDYYWTKINLFHQIKLPDLTVPISLIKAFHDSRWANISFFHRLMDVIDDGDSLLVSAGLVLTMVLVALFVFAKELQERFPRKKI